MGSNYNFRMMKPNWLYFRDTRIAGTHDKHYQAALNYRYHLEWLDFRRRYLENFQRDILRALAVCGIVFGDWDQVFVRAVQGKPPFQDLDRKAYKGELTWPFDYFRERLAREGKWLIHYPPLCPEWLFSFDYSQADYLSDLEMYWEDVDNAYYRPWSSLHFGEDSPEVARIKMLSEIARGEIDEVARQTGLYVQR